MFSDFMYGNNWKTFPKYNGPSSNIEHDSIDDLNKHFMTQTRNFGTKNTFLKTDDCIQQNSDSLLDILIQSFPHSTLEKNFWKI